MGRNICSCYQSNHIDKDVHLSQLSIIENNTPILSRNNQFTTQQKSSLQSYSKGGHSKIEGNNEQQGFEMDEYADQNNYAKTAEDTQQAEQNLTTNAQLREQMGVFDLVKQMIRQDRIRIQKNYETQMLDSLNEAGYRIRILKSTDAQNLQNFQNINQLIEMGLDTDKVTSQVQLIHYESAEFYRHVLVSYNGNPVATGSLNITSAPIKVVKENEEYEQTIIDEQELEQEPFLNLRAVIQYVMLDPKVVTNPQKDATVIKTLQALECLAWLYNCQKLQMELTTVPTSYLNSQNYWLVVRNQCYYYNKNVVENLKKMPKETREEFIMLSNQESANYVNFAPVVQ